MFEIGDVSCNDETIYDSGTKTIRNIKVFTLPLEPDLSDKETYNSKPDGIPAE